MPGGAEHAERSSFRDPAGTVVWRDGRVYRRIHEAGRRDYEAFMKSGLYEELLEHGLVVRHEELAAEVSGDAYLLKPEMVPFVSYPYEWSFSALKDAALATLEIQRRALERGFILKDASAFNVQFAGGRPVLIDTLSFEPYQGQRAWQAYAQFCRHFLAPLALMSSLDARLGLMLRDHIDGIPLDLAAGLLPHRSRLRPGLWLHLVAHAASQKRYASRPLQIPEPRTATRGGGMAKQSLLGLTHSLQRTVQGLRLPRRLVTEWGEYYTFTNYSDEAANHKAQLVTEFISQAKPVAVWDLGGNDGRFSRVALKAGAAQAVCFDVDPLAVEKNYRQVRRHHEPNLLPLLLDLTNPTPAIGWGNGERQALDGRVRPGTALMALALIHHLAISNNLPFGRIAEWFAGLGSHLIIEFVPKTDSKVQTLLATRKDIFDQYDQSMFEREFGRWFHIVRSERVAGSERTMYLMEAKPR